MVSRSTIAAIRYGYGFRPGETPPAGAEPLLAALKAGATDAPVLDSTAERLATVADLRAARDDKPRLRELKRAAHRRALADIAARIDRRAFSPHQFFERMTAFWVDHFAVSARKVGQFYHYGGYEDEVIRPHVAGRFADMLKAVVRSPAMLTYLDQTNSIGPNSPIGRQRGRGLNENLAREILELHTLGVGGPYTQADVREFAELLTGFAARPRSMTFAFRPNWAEPGAETVLGRTYGGDPARPEHVDSLLEDLARHPSTARHMARKLAVHFVADDPDPALVEHVATAWRAGGGELVRVAEALLEHPAAWTPPGAKVRRPVELLVATLRAAGPEILADADRPVQRGRQMLRALTAMGQPIFKPPGPDGWPEAAGDWITPQGLAGRLQFASAVGRRLARQRGLDPRDFADRALGEMQDEATRFVVGAAPDRWEAFALAIASPGFNRR